MIEYKTERNHKKLLVPIIALILCATAMVGLVYAAQTSAVTNQDNVVSSDGIDARLLKNDHTGLTDYLDNEGFSNVGYKFNPYTVQIGATHEFRVPVADASDKIIGVIGSGVLYLNSSDGENVDITFEVSFNKSDVLSPFGENVSVVLVLTDSEDVSKTVGATGLDVGAKGSYYDVELRLVANNVDEGESYAALSGVTDLQVFEDLMYDITIFAKKAE